MLRMALAVALLLFGAVASLRSAFYALLFYIGIAYFRPEAWVWGDGLQSLNISLIVGAYALVAAIIFRERLSFGLPVCLIAAFCLHGLVSSLLSAHADWCLPWWEQFAKISLISILIVGMVNTGERFRLTLIVITFALGFEGAKQGWVHVLLHPGAPNENALEVLGDNNGVAVGMLMLSAVVLALFQTTAVRWQKGMYAVILVGTVSRALTTYSRGGLLAFGAMCVMYMFRSRNRVRTALLVAVVAGVLLPLMPAEYWARMQTITSSGEERDGSAAGRLHFWDTARRMAADHPLLGVGTNGFQAAYDDYDLSDGEFGRGRAVHSTWFGVLADQGYVGIALFTGLMAGALRACARARAAARNVPGREMLFAFAGAMQAALVTVAVGGSFLSFHYVEILWHFMALSFALSRITRQLAEGGAAATVEPAAAYAVAG